MSRTGRFAALCIGVAVFLPNVARAETTIMAAGSTALQPLVQAAATAYNSTQSDVKVAVTGGGSRTGLMLVKSKTVDIGDSDIVAISDESDLVDHRVAAVGFALITHPASGVSNLSKKQIQDIFSGKVTNWKEVGGKNEAIVVINRPASSGTRPVFIRTLMGAAEIKEMLVEDATASVIQKVRQLPGAISYASFSGTHGKSGVVELAIDGIPADEENVDTGRYPFWSYEHMYTNGAPSKEISRFLAYVQSNSTLLRKLGYIPIRAIQHPETDR